MLLPSQTYLMTIKNDLVQFLVTYVKGTEELHNIEKFDRQLAKWHSNLQGKVTVEKVDKKALDIGIRKLDNACDFFYKIMHMTQKVWGHFSEAL